MLKAEKVLESVLNTEKSMWKFEKSYESSKLCLKADKLEWGMQAHAGRVTKVGKVSGKQMGFS